jgi:CBS-domain-containing membrane protein
MKPMLSYVKGIVQGGIVMRIRLIIKRLLPGAGGFLVITLCAFAGNISEIAILMAPFGATCVLLFALPESPLAQPRNIVGGHLISTFIGLLILHIVGNHPWSLGLAVGLAIVCMQFSKTVHPPAGADPIVVILAGAKWSFVFTPVLLGCLIIVAVGYYFHRILRTSYPKQWW